MDKDQKDQPIKEANPVSNEICREDQSHNPEDDEEFGDLMNFMCGK